jgi:hypothetical protein
VALLQTTEAELIREYQSRTDRRGAGWMGNSSASTPSPPYVDLQLAPTGGAVNL